MILYCVEYIVTETLTLKFKIIEASWKRQQMKLNKDDSIKGLQGRKETNTIRINIEKMNKRVSCKESGKPIGETNCYLCFG